MMKSEDQAYEQARQAQLDASREIQIGSQIFLMNDRKRPLGRLIQPRHSPHFAKEVPPQRFAHFDPAPHIPFSTPELPLFRSKLEKYAYLSLWIFAILVIIFA